MELQALENNMYTVRVRCAQNVDDERDTHQPFRNRFRDAVYTATLSETEDLTPAAEIVYRKRGGGVYIYSNNPEMLAPADVGQLLLKNDSLSGECFFTYEHSNHTVEPFFLGYQLCNNGKTPVEVTVHNIGNQVRGEWLGQREWSDFYSLKFDLPADYWLADGRTVNPIYVGGDYIDYTPRPYTPETFTVPAGGYLWVLGGTSGDKPFGSLSGGTADQAILNGRCANGAVRFTVSGGEVTGRFWCYTDPSQCDPNKKEQGYIVSRDGRNYAAQYKGIDDSTVGLAEADIAWVFGDATRAGRLPVTYRVRRDPNYLAVTEPYAKFDMQEFTVNSDSWLTSLNPNDNPTAVGTDMIVFKCITEDGREVCIDTESNDGEGKKSNIGNWMMQNGANYTLVNTGKRDRTLRFYSRGTGVLAVIVRAENGRVLEKKLLMQPYNFDKKENAFAGVDLSLLTEKDGKWWFTVEDGRPFCDVWDERSLAYTLTVPAGTVCRISIDDLILANSCGGVKHWVEID